MRILCLDLGTKTCGFAISDPFGIIATGIENYHIAEKDWNAVINKVKFFIFESEYKNEIDLIVLGYPIRMDLSKSERTLMVEEFKILLEKEIKIPVVFQDERQTTSQAEDILIQAGFTRKKRKTKKDSLAAQIILENYLERVK
ncbi:putative Holliday junction resolvase [Metamycoplasma subdolum]|uniref:Putative pre-16S rRNA nuclease n=1 Tax=Metamycoplasma subdolum TaxID=92407 RepID=A0A3M0A6D8_9BACT|nr:Holliday junction resolvase RuvX [Metamycoplasma subdolum]RMA79079.1 putative Holliday junction resolvase [Metamycoplasma subdolum]WPB50602.1 Holliday junction resolvase RuvX [Metamycoplasma subdolum]